MRHRIFGALTALLAGVTLASSLTNAAAPLKIQHFYTIEGAEGKNDKTLRELIDERVKNGINLDTLTRAMDQIYATGLYSEVEVYKDDGGIYTFKVVPIRHIRQIQYVGNKSFSKTELNAELGILENEGYDFEKIRTGIENIKKFYNLGGFLNAKVIGEFSQGDLPSDLVFKITIEEGLPCQIDSLTFKSVNSSLNRKLENHFSKNIAKNFTQGLLTTIQNDINEYLFDQRYLSSSVLAPEIVYSQDRSHVSLSYVVNDPYAFAFVFEGNSYFTDSKIINELKLTPSNRLSTAPLEDLSERMIRFYKTQGFANIEINYKETLFTQEYTRRIVFTIKEGSKVKIKDVAIDGVFSKSQKYYRDFILSHSSDLVASKTYNSDDIDMGVKNLVTNLQNQGFLAAKVSGTRTDFDDKKENAIIRVNLDEGSQTFIQKINFQGATHITQSELEKVIGLKEDNPLDLSTLENSSVRIAEAYHNRGFLDAQVVNSGKSIITYSANNTKATLNYEINEGPLITVGQVVLDGNSFTKDYVITRELQFHQGDVLTPDKIIATEQRLQRLGLFSSVEIHTLDENPAQGNRPVVVKVIEANPGVFKFGVGVNNDYTFSINGFAGVGYRNLFGTGRGVTSRVGVSDKTQYNFVESDISLGYTEPFVFGTENTGRVNLTRSLKLFREDPTTGGIYVIDNAQADFIIERTITEQLKLIYEFYGIARTNLYEIDNNIPALSPLLNIATTGPTLTWDRRNDPYNPTTGDVYSLSFEYSNPVMGSTSTVNYLKTIAGYNRYIPIGPLVWANEFKAGYLKNLSTNPGSGVPATKAFILGGRSTIRGFDPYSESIPYITEFPVPNNASFYELPTESHFYLVKTELRFPIYGNLGAAVFYDGGLVGFPEYHPRFPWRDAVGLGLRYITPVGPVSLEYGYKLNRDLSRAIPESPGQFLFSIGVF